MRFVTRTRPSQRARVARKLAARVSLPSGLVLVALFAVAACGKNNEPPPPSSGSPNAQPESGPSKPRGGASADGIPAEAKELFASKCAMCHGADGTGNTPAAGMLDPKPRNYTDAAWQASVTDDELKKIIVKGGQAVGKSGNMPGNPDLETKPAVVDGLVKIIRGFKK
jgi:mono/diheme cytochrome c family protein